MKIAVNEFVTRQVEGSGKTYSMSLSFEEMASHAEAQMASGHYSEGYRDGVRLVHALESVVNHFVCPFVKIDENTKFESEWVRRRPDEEPYIRTRALNGTPLKAGAVDFILYRHDVLAETNEHSTDADWELISINAIPKGVETLPMGPVTMMRNQLELPGGTKAFYASESYAESIRFWQEYAALKPKGK